MLLHMLYVTTLLLIIMFCVSSSQSTSVERPPHIDLPPSLHRWAAPEVIKRRACTAQADIYSLCALIQEVYTGSAHVPLKGAAWGI